MRTVYPQGNTAAARRPEAQAIVQEAHHRGVRVSAHVTLEHQLARAVAVFDLGRTTAALFASKRAEVCRRSPTAR
jgi:hypothetical protein